MNEERFEDLSVLIEAEIAYPGQKKSKVIYKLIAEYQDQGGYWYVAKELVGPHEDEHVVLCPKTSTVIAPAYSKSEPVGKFPAREHFWSRIIRKIHVF